MPSKAKRVLFQLGHPAHFHLYRNIIANLNKDGYQTFVLIKKKDILEDLLKKANMTYVNILPKGKRSVFSLMARWFRVFGFTLRNRVDVLVGSTPDVAQVAWVLRRRSVIMVEDDATIIPQFIRVVSPFVDQLLSPRTCNNGKLECKTTHYDGFQKLAYLHPNQFTPKPEIVDTYFPHTERYFLLRLVSLKAYHDVSVNAKGINDEIAMHLIEQLSPYGRVFVSAERELPAELKPYQLSINPLDIHHLMAFATLYIGDSQSMAVEAAMLGVPNIRFNDFAGKIGVLEELEQTYQLTCSIPSSEPQVLYDKVSQWIAMDDLKGVFQERRQKMLSEKIDVTAFMTEFIEHLPEKRR